MSDFSVIARRATKLLGKTWDDVNEEDLYALIEVTVLDYLARWTDLGATYEAITGNDKKFFDFGVAYLVAADFYEPLLRGSGSTNVTDTGQVIIRKKQSQQEVQYSNPSQSLSTSSNRSLPEMYAERGWKLLRRVAAIGFTTPLDTDGVTLVLQPVSTLSPPYYTDCDDWAIRRGLVTV